MKGEAIVLLRGRRGRITVMKKLWTMKLLLMTIVTITTEIRVITTLLVLMKMSEEMITDWLHIDIYISQNKKTGAFPVTVES